MTRFEMSGPLGVITIAHPPLNLFDQTLMAELEAALTEAESSGARALLFRAEGKVVSGGVDVGKVFDGISAAEGAALWGRLLALSHRVEEIPVPTIFAAHGLCLTAAFEISLACDLLLASPGAKFGLVERVVGLTPSMGGTQRLAERAGPARAKELVFTGELFSAETLERWNVVNRVLADDDFDAAARAFALGIAEGPTRAHMATKQIVRAQIEGSARTADGMTPVISGALFDTEDLRGAVQSFITEGPGRASFAGH
ncbi:MAG TPA: enoyl-CoA hydratase/isomerase family protein [Solirubrobacteraceae bacterium]|nr:enoyl-CoA hydratase/isomerase family protein [Solirubrobacteraceae bacterium]